jgi:dynein heavy chain
VEKERWEAVVVTLEEDMANMFGDVVLSAGIISYLGPYIGRYRDELVSNSWIPFVKRSGIRSAEEFGLKNVLATPMKILNWVIKGLPNDKTSIENAIILKNSNRCPLIIDP